MLQWQQKQNQTNEKSPPPKNIRRTNSLTHSRKSSITSSIDQPDSNIDQITDQSNKDQQPDTQSNTDSEYDDLPRLGLFMTKRGSSWGIDSMPDVICCDPNDPAVISIEKTTESISATSTTILAKVAIIQTPIGKYKGVCIKNAPRIIPMAAIQNILCVEWFEDQFSLTAENGKQYNSSVYENTPYIPDIIQPGFEHLYSKQHYQFEYKTTHTNHHTKKTKSTVQKAWQTIKLIIKNIAQCCSPKPIKMHSTKFPDNIPEGTHTFLSFSQEQREEITQNAPEPIPNHAAITVLPEIPIENLNTDIKWDTAILPIATKLSQGISGRTVIAA
jgi:hypothetical protein